MGRQRPTIQQQPESWSMASKLLAQDGARRTPSSHISHRRPSSSSLSHSVGLDEYSCTRRPITPRSKTTTRRSRRRAVEELINATAPQEDQKVQRLLGERSSLSSISYILDRPIQFTSATKYHLNLLEVATYSVTPGIGHKSPDLGSEEVYPARTVVSIRKHG